MHFLLEDADFSGYRIKKLIEEGEEDAETTLNKKRSLVESDLRVNKKEIDLELK